MIRIAITGPESSGKTTLAQALSKHFSADLILEYAREYLTLTNGEYAEYDLTKIATTHRENILKSQKSTQIIDTDFICMKVWSDYRFGKTSPQIQNIIEENLFDLHILCTPDIPWEEDRLRENPNDRHELFELYKRELLKAKKTILLVQGSLENRLKESINCIDKLSK